MGHGIAIEYMGEEMDIKTNCRQVIYPRGQFIGQ